MEGAQVWDLALHSSGQLRLVARGDGAQVVGFDMTAVLALGAALGVPGAVVAELMPAIEAGMVRASRKES